MSDELKATQIDRDHWFKMWESARAELAVMQRDRDEQWRGHVQAIAECDSLRADLAAERESATKANLDFVKMLRRADALEAERDALRELLRGATAVLEPVSFNMYDHDIREAARVMVSRIDAALNKGDGDE